MGGWERGARGGEGAVAGAKTLFLTTILLTGLLLACGTADTEPAVVVFAAASLRDAAAEIGREFERRHAVEVIFNFAGTNTLAQQIDAAPRADVFLSADPQWVDFLDHHRRTVPGTRRDFLSNHLVLIAHRDATVEIRDPRDLAAAGYRFLAVADPAAVPAGRYAKAALEQLKVDSTDLWTAVADRLAPALDVRAALALVESDPEILGIVYRTDARTSQQVRVLYEFPAAEEAPITYCATLVAGGGNQEPGRDFLDFLASSEARAIAEGHGFEIPVGRTPVGRTPEGRTPGGRTAG